MTLVNLPKRFRSWVLIEAAPADARFLGQWLLAAARADTLLEAQFKQDRSFERSVSRILLLHRFAFSPTAIRLRQTTDEESRFVFFVSF
jgi:hypothetical protein